MPKIAIDISPIIYGTGVSVYTRELIKNLDKNKDFEYLFFGYSLRQFKNIKKHAKKVLPIPPVLADIIWNRLHFFPIEKLVGKFDLLHTSDWIEPHSRLPKITTIHDLTPILDPKQTNSKVVSVHKRKLHWVKEESKAIIVPSEATKKDLISLGFKQQIEVIPEAVSESIYKKKSSEVEITLSKFRIKNNYLLVVGTAERKNAKNIFKAFEKVKSEVGVKHLVIVGNKPKDALQDRGVIYAGRVDDDELSALYSGATALVYASLYEGFGLPILEAFKCECPVVTSNVSSLPEVAGKAAILVDPNSVESIKNGIIKAVKNKKSLINKGLKREKQFSWGENAKRTINLYKEVIG